MAVSDDVLSRAKKAASSSGSRSPITVKLCAMLLTGIASKAPRIPKRGNADESLGNQG